MDTPMGNTGITGSSATDRGSMGGSTATGTGTCANCGQTLGGHQGLEQFLGKLGVNDEMIRNLKTQFQNVDVDQYLNTAREYLTSNSGKAKDFAKENPGKVAAGVAVLAVGAGLLISALNKD